MNWCFWFKFPEMFNGKDIGLDPQQLKALEKTFQVLSSSESHKVVYKILDKASLPMIFAAKQDVKMHPDLSPDHASKLAKSIGALRHRSFKGTPYNPTIHIGYRKYSATGANAGGGPNQAKNSKRRSRKKDYWHIGGWAAAFFDSGTNLLQGSKSLDDAYAQHEAKTTQRMNNAVIKVINDLWDKY